MQETKGEGNVGHQRKKAGALREQQPASDVPQTFRYVLPCPFLAQRPVERMMLRGSEESEWDQPGDGDGLSGCPRPTQRSGQRLRQLLGQRLQPHEGQHSALRRIPNAH